MKIRIFRGTTIRANAASRSLRTGEVIDAPDVVANALVQAGTADFVGGPDADARTRQLRSGPGWFNGVRISTFASVPTLRR